MAKRSNTQAYKSPHTIVAEVIRNKKVKAVFAVNSMQSSANIENIWCYQSILHWNGSQYDFRANSVDITD